VQLDKKTYSYYKKAVKSIKTNIKNVFEKDMVFISEEYNFDARGFFVLEYIYRPHNYRIKIENEFRAFNIDIYDDEGAHNVLYGIEPHDASLHEEQIRHTILLLKKVLEENDFHFYISKNDKLYRKSKDGIKRVRDISELYKK